MFTKDSKPYLYPFLNRIVVETGSTGLQYDAYPMSIDGQSRFFVNLVHGSNVVLEASVRMADLLFIKALVDGTINAAETYTLSDGSLLVGSEVISRIDAMLTEMRTSFERTIEIFTVMGGLEPYQLDANTVPAPQNELGVDVQAIFNRLSNRNGKILPDA